MPFAAAVSLHPVSARATGEVIGRVVEDVGTHPDLVVLLATGGHAGALEDVARTVRTLLSPTVLIGATVAAVIGEGADDEGGPGLALWAGLTGPVRALRWPSGTAPGAHDPPPVGWPTPSGGPFEASGALVIGDVAGGDGSALVRMIDDGRGGVPVAGGLSAGGPLVLDDRTMRGGAVGAVLGPGVHLEVVVGRGWRPIGPDLFVTDADADRGIVRELDGMPAMHRFRRLAADEIPATELPLINGVLGLGAGPAVWDVLGADRSNGAIATTGPVPAGSVVRFCVRDDPAPDLRRALQGREADTALGFVADPFRRGYGAGDHDAEIVSDALGTAALTGMVAPVQIGPVAGQLRALRADASFALITGR